MEATIRILMVPPREISPNARVDYRKKSEAIQLYRQAASLAVVNLINRGNPTIHELLDNPIPVVLDANIQWPRPRRGGAIRKELDHDNAIACLKPLIDGIAEKLWSGQDRHVSIGDVTQSRGDGDTVVTLRTLDIAPNANAATESDETAGEDGWVVRGDS